MSSLTVVAPERSVVSSLWMAFLAVSVVALGFFAPSGLALLGFLGLVIVLHEAGHLVVARMVGMKPTEFFWGFGPEIFAFQHRGCRYGVKALSLGGYVKLEGMTPSAELPEGFDEASTYRAAGHGGRLATILAGPLVNIGTGMIAFALSVKLGGAGWVDSMKAGPVDAWLIVTGTVDALATWATNLTGYAAAVLDFSGQTEPPVRFLSPVAQAEVSGWAVSNGTRTSLLWFGVLSVAIGALNLLPLPPLDGSHAAVVVVEWVIHRVKSLREVRIDVNRLLPLAYLTLAILITLSLSALVLDLRATV